MNKLSFLIFIIAFYAVMAASTTKGPKTTKAPKGKGKCIIAPEATTNCSGVVGANCNNVTNLLSLVKSNQLTALVCEGKVQVPTTKKILLELNIKPCDNCPCFTIPTGETRTCKVLNADATFVKNSCSDQGNLRSILATSDKVKICLAPPKGSFVQTSAKIKAKV